METVVTPSLAKPHELICTPNNLLTKRNIAMYENLQNTWVSKRFLMWITCNPVIINDGNYYTVTENETLCSEKGIFVH